MIPLDRHDVVVVLPNQPLPAITTEILPVVQQPQHTSLVLTWGSWWRPPRIPTMTHAISSPDQQRPGATGPSERPRGVTSQVPNTRFEVRDQPLRRGRTAPVTEQPDVVEEAEDA